MELGALVCLPSEPKCLCCPVAKSCQARQTNQQDVLPVSVQKKSYQSVHEIALIIAENESVLMRQCGDDERWAGMWDFPRVRLEGPATQWRTELAERIERMTGVRFELGDRLATLRHTVTRYRIRLDAYWARSLTEADCLGRSLRWATPSQLRQAPMNTTGRKLAVMVQKAMLAP